MTTPSSTTSGSASAEDGVTEPTEGLAVAVTTEDLADEEVDGEELDLELGSPWHDSEAGQLCVVLFYIEVILDEIGLHVHIYVCPRST